MITIKEALKIAKKAIIEVIDKDVYDIRFEEVDLDPKNDYWELVISFLYRKKIPSVIPALDSMYNAFREYERLYKKVIVNKKTGEVIKIIIFKNE